MLQPVVLAVASTPNQPLGAVHVHVARPEFEATEQEMRAVDDEIPESAGMALHEANRKLHAIQEAKRKMLMDFLQERDSEGPVLSLAVVPHLARPSLALAWPDPGPGPFLAMHPR